MPQLAPVVKDKYTDEERAIAAGYLIHMRVGTLQALASAKAGAQHIEDDFTVGLRRYYRDCESYSRFLLYWAGYEVNKGQLYNP